jgi:hypothetical protein
MKSITDAIDWKTTIEVGSYKLHPCIDYPDGSKSIWIEKEDGEGGQFPVKKLEEVLKKFYNKYF